MKTIVVGVVFTCCISGSASAQFQSSKGSAFQANSGDAFGSSRGAFQTTPQSSQSPQQPTPQRQSQSRQPAKQTQQPPSQPKPATYANGYSQPPLPNNGYYPTSQPYTKPVVASPKNAATVYPNGYYSSSAAPLTTSVAVTPAAPPAASRVYANGYYVPANTQPTTIPDAFSPARGVASQPVLSAPAGARVYANGYYDSPREQSLVNSAFDPGSNAVVHPANATVYDNGYYSAPSANTAPKNTVVSNSGQGAAALLTEPVTPPAGTTVYANGYYSAGSTYQPPSNTVAATEHTAMPAPAETRRLSSIASDGTKYFSDGTYQKPGSPPPVPNPSALGSTTPTSSSPASTTSSGRYLAAIATDGTRYYSDGTSEAPSSASSGGISASAQARPSAGTAVDATSRLTKPGSGTVQQPGTSQQTNFFNLPSTSIKTLTPEQQKYSATVVAGMGRLKEFLDGFSMVSHIPGGVSPNYDRGMEKLLNAFMDTPNGQRVAYEMGTGDMKYDINRAFAIFSGADKAEKKLTDYGFPPEVLELIQKINEEK